MMLLCANATGNGKINMWVIGQFVNPRCFGKQKNRIRHLPIQYRNNKTAWMTGTILREWLSALKSHVLCHKSNRKVLLLVDGFRPIFLAYRNGKRNLSILAFGSSFYQETLRVFTSRWTRVLSEIRNCITVSNSSRVLFITLFAAETL